jgi:hypothetical protein
MSEKRPFILPKVCSCTSKNQLSIPWAWALQVGSILLLKCANNYVHKKIGKFGYDFFKAL